MTEHNKIEFKQIRTKRALTRYLDNGEYNKNLLTLIILTNTIKHIRNRQNASIAIKRIRARQVWVSISYVAMYAEGSEQLAYHVRYTEEILYILL